MGLNPRAGKLLYGALFTLVLPLALWLWNSRLNCPLPAPHSVMIGIVLVATGGLFMLLGMWELWRDGGGLPMNAFPPPKVVARGVYAVVPHPIYFGFVAVCAGAAMVSQSAAGIWIVTPTAALGCLSLVLGYESPELRRRFGSRLPEPWLGVPKGQGFLPISRRLGAALAVLLPFALAYWAVKILGVPVDAFETRMKWEWAIPIVPGTMPIYASIYLLVPLVFFMCSDRREMRRLMISGWLATGLNTLLYLAVPATAAFRSGASRGWLGAWLNWEQAMARPAAGSWPSFSVTWTVICAAFMVRWKRPTPAGPTRHLRPFPALCWLWCAALCFSCLTTGMHSVLDVLAGLFTGAVCVCADGLWRRMLTAAERLGNAWRAWRFGSLRLINHGFWSGLAGFMVLLLAGISAGPNRLGWLLFVACCALIGAGLWAQWVEGSAALLRPFGYFGAILGGLMALAFVGCVQGPASDLMAGFALAAPWTQAIGRLRCIVQGCCHGRPVRWGIRVTNPHSRVVKLAGFCDAPIHPTPLYSILAN